MKTGETRGQGLAFVTDEVTGVSYPIPSGGSGNEAPPQGDGAGTVSENGNEGVQSTADRMAQVGPGSETQTQETTEPTEQPQESTETQTQEESGQEGQGFLEPYLKDVPEDQRDVVAPVLEKYRQEQDRNFNQRFEQLRQETDVPVRVHQALIQDPEQTIDWIADRLQEERGIDVRQALLSRWNGGQSQETQTPGQGQEAQSGEEDPENKPLTQAEFDRLLKEREEQQAEERRRQELQQQQATQQQQTVYSWIDNAAKQFSLPLDDSEGEDPLRQVIVMQANDLHEKGVAKGQAAVEMAVESISKRFGNNGAGNQGAQNDAPRVAEGGSAPPAEKIDITDPKQRKARMEELFSPASNQ